MFVNIKILRGAECTVEVEPTASVGFVKQLVMKRLGIPVPKQRLVFGGKTLLDKFSLGDYNVFDGSKIFLFVCDEAAAGGFWSLLQIFLEKHFSPDDSAKVVVEFKKIFYEQVSKLSLDDIERIAIMNLEQEKSAQDKS